MTQRSTDKTVTFRRPFCLKGVDRLLPPADYRVVTDEELIEGVSFTLTVALPPSSSCRDRPGAEPRWSPSSPPISRPRRTRMRAPLPPGEVSDV